jgi:hypothetical protein
MSEMDEGEDFCRIVIALQFALQRRCSQEWSRRAEQHQLFQTHQESLSNLDCAICPILTVHRQRSSKWEQVHRTLGFNCRM